MDLQPTQRTRIPKNTQDEKIEVTLTIPKSKYMKLMDWMHSDTWEKMQELRDADFDQQIESVLICAEMSLRDHGGARAMAQLLASLYNGNRVKANLSEIYSLDSANFEHFINVLRLCKESHTGPHSFIVDGGDVMERIIKNWRLDKRGRA